MADPLIIDAVLPDPSIPILEELPIDIYAGEAPPEEVTGNVHMKNLLCVRCDNNNPLTSDLVSVVYTKKENCYIATCAICGHSIKYPLGNCPYVV